jgi:hypothetical protein
VVLRLTRTGLLKWERDWRRAARAWLKGIARRRGLREDEVQARRVVQVATGLERIAAYGTVVILISLGWFALFPQTQPLAAALLQRVLGPILDLIGFTARSLFFLLYSGLVLILAARLSRRLSRLRSSRAAQVAFDPTLILPIQLALWLAALFLILFPYEGAPRTFAIGLLLLSLLGATLAVRPLLEGIVAGIYLQRVQGLRAGVRVRLEGGAYVVLTAGLAHFEVESEEGRRWIPYSRLLSSEHCILDRPSENG